MFGGANRSNWKIELKGSIKELTKSHKNGREKRIQVYVGSILY